MKRAGDVEPRGAQSLGRGVGGGGVQRVRRAGQHDLAGRVVVGEADAVARGHRGRLRRGRAEHGEHRAAAGLLAGDRHQQPAQRDEAQAVALVERAGDDQRGQLAERVAGERDRVDVTAHALPAGQRRAEDRGLRKARGRIDARERILADERRDLREEVGSHRRDELAHPGLLAALPWEEHGGLCRLKHTVTVAHPSSALNRCPPTGGVSPIDRSAGRAARPPRGCGPRACDTARSCAP